jgi:chaperonin GroEL
LSYLQETAKQLTTVEEIAQIGTISANGDRNIGDLIAQAMEKVGRDGIITVDDAKGMSTSLEIVEGMQFDRGYLSPYFVTNSEKMNIVFQDAKILLTDKKISSMKDLISVLEKTMQHRTPLLIIAEDVEGEALQGLVLNKLNANLQVVAIKAPGFGKYRDELLSDIAIMTGAKLVSNSTGLKLESLTLEDLGSLKKVVVDAKSSTLVANGSTKAAIEERIKELKFQMQDLANTTEDTAKLKTRIAKLSSGIAVIKVGGATELEMIEKKYRIEDALNATKAAADEGIVPGGGMALFDAVSSLSNDEDVSQNVRAGIGIVVDACLAPLRRIVHNAGGNGDVVINELKRLENRRIGYNAATDMYEDLVATGVIDPVKVTKTALKNAASVTTTFLNLDVVIVDEETNAT